MTEKFWFVWNPARNLPAHKHTTFNSAKFEAERLARANAPEKFIILESLGEVQKVDVAYTPHEDERPF